MVLSSAPSPIQLPGTECYIRPQFSLADLTSYRVGGEAQWYVAPRTWEELQAAFEWFGDRDLPLMHLGAGSNLLISDRGIPGLVLCTRYLRRASYDPERATITASAG
jgi:UDP-N-acetylmuramate dehydrogenase